MLIYFLGGQLNLLPVAGRIEYGIEVKTITRLYLLDSLITGNFPAFWSALQHLLMPAFTWDQRSRHRYTHLAIERARSHAPGLRHNSAGERLERKNRDLATYIAKCLITIVTILGLQLARC